MRFIAPAIFSFFVLFVSLIYADVEEHLKKLHHKPIGHALRNIDYIYMINLDQRPEKWKNSVDQLTPYGIYPYRFAAINGWELSLETIHDVGLRFSPEMAGESMATCYHLDGNYQPSHETMRTYGQTYFSHCLSRGAIGIALSHISILQDAWDSGYETIWVMEDDIEVIRDPRLLCELIDKLDATVGKDNWDILFTDRDIRDQNGQHKACYAAVTRPDFTSQLNDYAKKYIVSEDFYKIGSRWGAHSMILRRKGIKKLLQFFKAHQIFFPYDMEYILPRGINLYALLEDVVSNLPRATSDNGAPSYLKKE